MAAVDMPEDVQAEILRRLKRIEQEEAVHILFAIESGSRAWGFASPDSDFDVRFVYVHHPDWYLSIQERRDVIERPVDGIYDINGWDVRKTLKLLVKPNPVLLEWLGSPILYRREQVAFARLQALAEQTAHQRPSQYHYLHLGQSQYQRHIAGKPELKLKKYFYVLRPALALQWLRIYPDAPVPVDFRTLMNRLELPEEIQKAINNLLLQKRAAQESGLIAPVPVLDRFVEQEFSLSAAEVSRPASPDPALLDTADNLFRQLVRDYGSASL